MKGILPMTRQRVYSKFATLCISFSLINCAYYAVEALQSSQNKATGTYGLSILYTACITSSIFLAPLVMEYSERKLVMCFPAIFMMTFFLANYYPRPSVLITSSLLAGVGVNLLWVANRIHVSDLAEKYAKIVGQDKDNMTKKFFSIFFSCLSVSMLVGNGVSSIVMRFLSKDTDPTASNTSSEYRLVTGHFVLWNSSHPKCGIHNCDHHKSDHFEASKHQSKLRVDKDVLYLLIGGFTATYVIASIIMLWCVFAQNDGPVGNAGSETENILRQSKIRDRKGSEEKEPIRHIIKKNILASANLHAHPSAILLIPFSVHVGLLQGFALSQFTRDWITCTIGIQYIGYVVACYGVGSIFGSYGSGVMPSAIPRWAVVLFNVFLEISTWVTLILWEPKQNADYWLFYVTIFALGFVHTSKKAICATLYSLYFSNEKNAALSVVGTWDGLGKALAFGISAHICNMTYITLLIIFSIVGTILYFVTEIMYSKR